jgi:hypothetical protein
VFGSNALLDTQTSPYFENIVSCIFACKVAKKLIVEIFL